MARSRRGKELEDSYYAALSRTVAAQNARTGTVLQTNGTRLPAALTRDQRRALTASRFESSTSPVAAPTTQPTAMPSLSLQNIVGAVGNAVGNLFGTAPVATGPTPSSPSLLTSVVGAASTAATVLLPGTGAVLAGQALASLPGRANGGGTSEFLLERPSGSTALERIGIPAGWTKKKVKALVRFVGVGQASAIIGAPLEAVAIVAISPSRRSRGISARDLRITKRTTRRVLGIARDLAALRPSAPRRSASRTIVRC